MMDAKVVIPRCGHVKLASKLDALLGVLTLTGSFSSSAASLVVFKNTSTALLFIKPCICSPKCLCMRVHEPEIVSSRRPYVKRKALQAVSHRLKLSKWINACDWSEGVQVS